MRGRRRGAADGEHSVRVDPALPDPAAEARPTARMQTMSTDLERARGVPLPLGVHPRRDGYNFAVFSRHARRIWLQLFADPADGRPTDTIDLHRSGDIWHVWLRGLEPGQAYAYRADGAYEPAAGHRFNRHRLLLDPHARAVAGTADADFSLARDFDPKAPADRRPATTDNAARMAKCLIVDQRFDWQGDELLRRPWTETVIYETHVRGLTVHPSAAVRAPGTFQGVIEKIPYLRMLGVTALELMPVQEFNQHELTRRDPGTGEPLRNYWGYSTAAFFAPKQSYAASPDAGAQVGEFKTMVRALHRAGIEVILDVVFNHTAEGDETGPTLCFRGLDNLIYYLLSADRRHYQNFSGCGNTFNSRHPVVQDYVLECLRYWVTEMHVDGFRFDLASALGRDSDGELLANPPMLERIAEDPILRDVKLIAEAWDAAGAYQVGSFPGQRWSEWNAAFRDDVRRFWRGDPGMTGAFASRLCGSADLYQRGGERPINSINYVTCHDGFTLNDLVSYRDKRNLANGEDNRDGASQCFSEHYGIEGPTGAEPIEAVRDRQIKNLLATLMLARGVPMLLGGDEFRRSQGGNNNAYCQDDDVSWYDWSLVDRHAALLRFVRQLIAFRHHHPVLRADAFYTEPEVRWFGEHGASAGWRADDRSLACLVHAAGDGQALFMAFNAGVGRASFVLPPSPIGGIWRVAIDTAAASPGDACRPGAGRVLRPGPGLEIDGRALVVLSAGRT
jgi:isoamylase